MATTDTERFLETCREMQRHWSGPQRVGRHWGRQSDRMIEQITAHSEASPFSSANYLLDSFGAGILQADAYALRRSLARRVIGRYQRAVRRALGYGSIGDLLLWPFDDEELIGRVFVYGRIAYSNAVACGARLLWEHIDRYDIQSPTLFAEQRVRVGGRDLSWLTLLSLHRVIQVRAAVGSIGTVLEIGAGTGEFARIMLSSGTAQRYVIVDVPPALAVAQSVLQSEFPAAELDLFDAGRRALNREARCAFLTPDQIGLIGSADLGINFASFGEMTRTIVRAYVELAKRVGVRAFVSINTRRPHPVMREELIDEAFYTSVFAPEFAATKRARWSEDLDFELRDSTDDDGYQWILFSRVDL